MRSKRNYIDLFKEFFVTDFKLRYKHSVLGFVWVIIKPLSLFTILYFVWSSLFHTAENFALYLLLGVITINFFNEGINFGLQSLFLKAHIILKINFPREIVVFSSVSIAIVNFLINLIIFFCFATFNTLNTSFAGVVLVLMALVSLVLLILGLSLFLSILSVKFHDIRHLIELVLQLVFWGTPVLYDINILPTSVRQLVVLNPLTHILLFLRLGLLNAPAISMDVWRNAIIIFVCCVLITLLGIWFFNSKIRKIAEFF